MLYFKNSELTKTYKVALNTVLGWIKAAQNGKLDLGLVKVNERYYIANTAKNVAVLGQLVEERKKYRNSRNARVTTPLPKFYELFTQTQLLDIISSLDIHHEIPFQYSYFDGGADVWNDYANRMVSDPAPNLLTRTIKLLELNGTYLDELFAPYEKVNLVDLGPGNGLPVKELLGKLLERGILHKYIALDISPTILENTRANIKTWFGDDSFVEGHVVDLTQDRFGHLLVDPRVEEGKLINLVVFLGGTISNFRNPDDVLNIVHHSLGRNDIFAYSRKLDTAQSRRFFDFSSKPGHTALSEIHRMMPELLNIDPNCYEVEMGYDGVKNQRYIQIRLKQATRLDFHLGGSTRSVSLEKGDALLIWRARQINSVQVLQQLISNGFYPLHISQTSDKEYIVTISRIQTETDS
jgi:uncharacterized SAM-dependent methyltransferase